MPDGTRFAAGAQSDDVLFGQFNSQTESGIALVHIGDGQFVRISSYGPNTSGLYAMAAEWPWVAWTQGESKTNFSDWSVKAWNQLTGTAVEVANSRREDGSYVSGQLPTPILVRGRLLWSQPLSNSASAPEAEIRVRDLSNGLETTLVKGVVSSPVLALGRIIWARRTIGGAFTLQAADPATLESAALPTGLDSPGSVGALAGSAQLLAWSTDALQEVSVFDAVSNQRTIYRSPDINHYLQFPQIAGRYLIAYGGATSTLIDLDTASGFDVHGSVSGSRNWIVIEEPSKATTQKGQFVASRLTIIPPDSAPGAPRCN